MSTERKLALSGKIRCGGREKLGAIPSEGLNSQLRAGERILEQDAGAQGAAPRPVYLWQMTNTLQTDVSVYDLESARPGFRFGL